MRRLTPAQMDTELQKTQTISQGQAGRWAEAFRPPYASGTHACSRPPGARGCIPHLDHLDRRPRQARERQGPGGRGAQGQAGAIILMHANGRGWKTAEALPQILAVMQKKGLRR